MPPLAAPEPMNATASHSKVRVSVTLAQPSAVAGAYVAGRMQMECKTDKLGIGIMMVELFAFEELASRDHSARMTFLHSRRLFQGPSLPPSNAVQAHPLPGDPPMPEDYYKARRGQSTFLFRIPLPSTCPASISFASGLAKVRYEVRASVGVYWKGEKQLVTDKQELGVLESFGEDFSRAEPEGVIVGENGRFWVHGKVVGGMIVAGESACVELQVKNHSNRKNTGLVLSLDRTLVLPNASADPAPLHLSDTVLTVPFRGPEYILPPGGEGVANLVFDVPIHARNVRGGTLEDDESEARVSEALFEIRATVEVRVAMGLGSKDIILSIPVTIVHPDALPELPPEAVAPAPPQGPVYPQYTSAPGLYATPSAPNAYQQPQPHALLPIQAPYVDQQNQVWLPQPQSVPASHTPVPYQYYPATTYYSSTTTPPAVPHSHPQHHQQGTPTMYTPPRPSSAGPITYHHVPLISGLPAPPIQHPRLLPLPSSPNSALGGGGGDVAAAAPFGSVNEASPGRAEREEGKGDRASRISAHLRLSSAVRGRGRSVSPVGHRFPLPVPESAMLEEVDGGLAMTAFNLGQHQAQYQEVHNTGVVHSPRPQLRHKQSFTVDPVTNNSLTRSENVVELEKMAAEAEKDVAADDRKKGGGGLSQNEEVSPVVSPKTPRNPEKREIVVVMKNVQPTPRSPPTRTPHISSPTRLLLSPQEMNKTLPVPPPVTKPRHLNRENKLSPSSVYTTPLDSLFANAPTSSTRTTEEKNHKYKRERNNRVEDDDETRREENAIYAAAAAATAMDMDLGTNNILLYPVPPDQTPPTPTIVAFKRPPRTEGGLDALERRLLAEVGTRKVERERRPDVRDVLGGTAGGIGKMTAGMATAVTTAAVVGRGGGGEVGMGKKKGGGVGPIDIPATSTATNADGSASSERLDDSAISSLTLPDCGDPQKNWEDRRDERERERDQDSVDGKTHKAGKSRGPGSVGGEEERYVTRDKAAEAGVKKRRERPRGNVRTRKSSKGRVTAWLGEIDPGVPPQEEIIPPSPSVVAPPPPPFPELDHALGGSATEAQGEEEGKFSAVAVPVPGDGTSTSPGIIREEEDIPRQGEDNSADVSSSTSPNPRSSGFVPIGTLKRDTVAMATLRRGHVAREMTVAEEARKITTLWSEVLPSTAPKPLSLGGNDVEKDGKQRPLASLHPLMVQHVPKTQTIRTDRRVSPPSASPDVRTRSGSSNNPLKGPDASAIGNDLASGASLDTLVLGQLPVSGSHAHVDLALLPSSSPPISPASNNTKITSGAGAKVAGDAGKKKEFIQPSPRFPVFPPLTRQDPEVKYDVRSARGGRGGKVTAVASLWASAAAAAAMQSERPSPLAKQKNGDGKAGGIPTRATKAGADAGVMIKQNPKGAPTAPIKPTSSSPSSPPPPPPPSTLISTAAQINKLPPPAAPPLLVPKKTPTSSSSPTTTSTSASGSGGPKTPTPEPASSTTTIGGGAVKMAKVISGAKSPSVPAMVSSSLATPTLSSTASLARPVGGVPVVVNGRMDRGGAETKQSRPVLKGNAGTPGQGIGPTTGTRAKGGINSTRPTSSGGGGNAIGGTSVTAITQSAADSSDRDIKKPLPPPPREMAFGQARLRDLIKKYQG